MFLVSFEFMKITRNGVGSQIFIFLHDILHVSYGSQYTVISIVNLNTSILSWLGITTVFQNPRVMNGKDNWKKEVGSRNVDGSEKYMMFSNDYCLNRKTCLTELSNKRNKKGRKIK